MRYGDQGRRAVTHALWVGLVACAMMVSGCSSSGGGAPYTAPDTTPPVVTDFAITPPSGAWRGGTCAITIQATDDDRVASATAHIDGPGITTGNVALSPVAGGTGYTGSVTIPANTNAGGTPNTYYVTVWALDPSGNSSTVEQSLTFTVPAPDVPLPPPTW